MAKSIKIISIHYGHNASVAYLQDGEVKFCVSEERFNRIKNSTGFPKKALEFILHNYQGDIDYYILTQRLPWGINYLKKHEDVSTPYNQDYSKTGVQLPTLYKFLPQYFMSKALKSMLASLDNMENDISSNEEMIDFFKNKLNVPKEKILFLDHHQAHALSTVFFIGDTSNPTLIFTLDGEGDGLCATVGVFENGNYKIISRVNRVYSLGYLYREVTAFLGMKPDEHEFKVMGLAPYAKPEHAKKIIPIFKDLLWLNKKDEFESSIPMPLVKYVLKDKLSYHRFDNIAGAIQNFTEEITTDWIRRWIKKTGITNIALAGGVFMNVKANQKISELSEVSSLTVVPSAGDESTVLGGVYFGYTKFCQENRISCEIKKINSLSLGCQYSEEDVKIFLEKNNYFQKYKITKPEKINEKIAELLANNKVVARLAGRMEFGARALGNRSILANPASQDNVKIINEMIKNRDFWMPFATSIISEDAARYFINPKDINASFMAITFDTTELAQKHLPAALHPYDKTSRPQIVKKEDNPDYHEIISEFKKLTDIGGVLNTSFNLHGEPNVMSLEDAMHTFENSGLEYLVLENYLISKL